MNLSFADYVTITSADKAQKAVLKGLLVDGSSHLRFEDLEFAAPDVNSSNAAHKVVDSTNVQFTRLYVHGSLNGDPTTDSMGISIVASRNVSVTDSEFTDLRFGVGHARSDTLTISGNLFHVIRIDGVRGTGTDNLTISNNFMTDFRKQAVDHSDGIQLWTSNALDSAENITITGNVIVSNSRMGELQGIFLRDEVGGLPFRNVNISGNTILGGNYNGISVLHGENVSIRDNVVFGQADKASWIRVRDVTGLTLENNQAQHIMSEAAISAAANTMLAAPVAGSASPAVLQWLEANAFKFPGAVSAIAASFGIVFADVVASAPPPPPEPEPAPATPLIETKLDVCFVHMPSEGGDTAFTVVERSSAPAPLPAPTPSVPAWDDAHADGDEAAAPVPTSPESPAFTPAPAPQPPAPTPSGPADAPVFPTTGLVYQVVDGEMPPTPAFAPPGAPSPIWTPVTTSVAGGDVVFTEAAPPVGQNDPGQNDHGQNDPGRIDLGTPSPDGWGGEAWTSDDAPQAAPAATFEAAWPSLDAPGFGLIGGVGFNGETLHAL